MKSKFQVLSFILSLALIVYMLSMVHIGEVFKQILRMDLGYYLLGLFAYFLSHLSRAYRLRFIFGPNRFGKYLTFISVHQALTRTLPLKSGEIFFPVIAKKLTGIEYSKAVPKLFIIRLYDLIAMLVSFLVIYLFIDIASDTTTRLIMLTCLLVLVIILITLKYSYEMFMKMIIFLSPLRLKGRLKRFTINSRETFSLSLLDYILLLPISMIDKLLNFIACYIIISGIGFKLDLFEIIAANTLASFTAVLPINSFGSFGTTEAGWAGTLIYLGIDKETAISSGFGFNVILFSYTVFLGVIGYLFMLGYYKTNIFSRDNNNHTGK